MSENLALLLDTHCLVWFGSGSPLLSPAARAAMSDDEARLCVSAVTAWEYCDLLKRGRIPKAADFAVLVDRLDIELLDFPADLWTLAAALPDIHRDPVDRMLAAHCLITGSVLVTCDSALQRYPIKTLW